MRRSTFRIVFLAVLGAAAIGACSLNPQPIPPGEEPDAGGKQDFGGGGPADANTENPTPGIDSGVGSPPDGGEEDAGNSSDAGTEDASDAEPDADAS